MDKVSKTVNGISWTFAEKVLTDITSAIVSIILARILLPEDYGLIAIVQIFLSFSSIFIATGLGTALVQKKDISSKQISTVFYLNLFVGLFIYIILFLFAPIIARWKCNDDLTLIIRILSLKVPITSVYNIQHAYIKKKQQFKKFFFSSLFGTIASGIIGVAMALSGCGVWSLVISTLVDGIMDSTILFFSTRWFPKFQFDLNDSKQIIMFGYKLLISEFLTRVYSQMRSIIIGFKYSSSELAFDNKGQKFPASIVEVLDTTIIRVLLPTFSEKQNSKEELRKLVSVSCQLNMFILLPMMVGLFTISDRLIVLILTNKWVDCIPFLKIYCFVYLLSGLLSIDKRVAEASGEGDAIIIKNIADIAFSILLLLFVIYRFDSPISIVMSLLVSNIFSFYTVTRITKKVINYGLISHLKDSWNIIVSGLIMGICVYALGNINLQNDFVIIVFQILFGILIYVTCSFLLKVKSLNFIWNYIKNKANESKKCSERD